MWWKFGGSFGGSLVEVWWKFGGSLVEVLVEVSRPEKKHEQEVWLKFVFLKKDKILQNRQRAELAYFHTKKCCLLDRKLTISVLTKRQNPI